MRIRLSISNCGGRKPLSIDIDLLHDNEKEYPRDHLFRCYSSLDNPTDLVAEIEALIDGFRSVICFDSVRRKFEDEIISVARRIEEERSHPDEEETDG